MNPLDIDMKLLGRLSEKRTWREVWDSLPNLFGHEKRRVWVRDGRAHFEVKELDEASFETFAERLERRLTSVRGVHAARLNGITGRVVVDFDPKMVAPGHLERLVTRVEDEMGYAEREFPSDRTKYPADIEHLSRRIVKMSADTGGVSLGTMLKVLRYKPSKVQFDVAGLFNLLDNMPKLREPLEQLVGDKGVDVGVGVIGAFVQAVGSGPIGPGIDLALQALKLRAEAARRELWAERERELCDPFRSDRVRPLRCPKRPTELPEGHVESYADEAWYASMGGFVVGLADTHNLEASLAPLFGGLPKAARYGRQSFVAEFTRVLAARRIIAMRPQVLEHLDRISAIVVEGELLCPKAEGDAAAQLDPHTRNLARAIRRSGARFVLATDSNELVHTLGPDEKVAPDEVLETVHRLQREGQVVALIATGRRPVALSAADISIGFDRDTAVPWTADLITTDDLDDATFVVEGSARAAEVAEQSVVLAGLGAAIGTMTTMGGLDEDQPNRVMLAVNTASFIALANGIREAHALEKAPRPMVRDATPWHALERDDAMQRLGVSLEGLREEEAASRWDEPAAQPAYSARLAGAISKELVNPFTPILAAGAALSAVTGSPTDAGLIAGVVAFNAVVGGVQRLRAETAIEEMAQREIQYVRTRRDGEVSLLPEDRLVVGDVIELRSGESVPADCRLLSADGLEVDESALTGESLPVHKTVDPSPDAPVAERSSMLYEGTSIAAGEAVATVVALPPNTESHLGATSVEGLSRRTGVAERLHDIADLTVPVAAWSGALLTSVGLIREQDLQELVGAGVGMSVAAVPEGLPLLATIAQLAAAHRLTHRGVLVRNARAVEALGRVDVLCADKTGTLTRGKIRLHSVCDGSREALCEEGADTWVRHIVAAALRASPQETGERLPHATDRAVVEGARELGVAAQEGHEAWSHLFELPFRPGRGYYGALGMVPGGLKIAVKGAPEVVVARCTHKRTESGRRKIGEPAREKILAQARELAGKGLRVLALAERSASDREELTEERIDNLTFVGFVTLSDPIRPTSADSIRRLAESGIEVVMITGDHPETASRIAHELHLINGKGLLTGEEIDALSDAQLEERMPRVSVVARATPLHKVRIVQALQRLGKTVAMTGDGGNDASAIRLADVGIALGKNSTAAARNAADLVIVEEKIEAIVDAIAEGRAMWKSVRDAVSILVGGNLGEIGFTVASGLFGSRPALNARQLLLVNFLTDVAPALAIALRPPPDENLMEHLGAGPEQELGDMLDRDILLRSVITASGALAAWTTTRILRGNERCASTVSLLALVGSQLGQTLVAGEPTRETMLASVGSAAAMLAIVEIPGVSQFFGCRPVGPISLATAAISSAAATGASVIAPDAIERVLEWWKTRGEAPEADRRPLPPSDETFEDFLPFAMNEMLFE